MSIPNLVVRLGYHLATTEAAGCPSRRQSLACRRPRASNVRRSPQKCTITYPHIPRPQVIASPCPSPTKTLRRFHLEGTTVESVCGVRDATLRSGDDSRSRPSARITGVTPGSSQPTKFPKQFLTSVDLNVVTSSASSLRDSMASSFTTSAATTNAASNPFNLSCSNFEPLVQLYRIFDASSRRRQRTVLRNTEIPPNLQSSFLFGSRQI